MSRRHAISVVRFETLSARTLLSSVGPDGYGYVATNTAFEAIDLLPGGPGVVTLHGSDDDASAAIPLGSNTFTFYGAAYTGSDSLYVSTNGLITLGAANAAFSNANLTSSPTQPAIAAHWDDLNIDGANSDSVLYKFESNRLIIEWNNISLQGPPGTGSITFQAILSLNTAGDSPIVLNYPDLDTGNALFDNGATATAGIKDSGTQGTNRLLISHNDGSTEFLGSGQAVRISTQTNSGPQVLQGGLEIDAIPQAVTVAFDRSLNGTLSLDDLSLFNHTTSQAIPASVMSLNFDEGIFLATLTFPNLPNDSLSDGNYTLTIASAGVTDAGGTALDGDGDGTPGGDYELDFALLLADANTDSIVNTLDFNVLAGSFGQSGKVYSQGNFDYTDTVNSLDFGILAQRYGQQLQPLGLAVPLATSKPSPFSDVEWTQDEDSDLP